MRTSADIARPAARQDRSLAVILFMMTLVFAPAAALHLAAKLMSPPGEAVAAVPGPRLPG